MEEERALSIAEGLQEAPSSMEESASRLKLTRDRLLNEAARQLIRLGRERPRLKQAGYWLYGAATRYLPRGEAVQKLAPVGPGVYRGAQPSIRALATLKALGIDTVINLRPESDYERRFVKERGMGYLHLPLPPLDAPAHALTLEFIEAVSNPANGAVFFHCFHGVDRTGTMAACLRMARDEWTMEAALEEMRAFGAHEQAQLAKVAYLTDWAVFWAALPLAERCAALHLPLPEAPLEAAPSKSGMRAWLRKQVETLQRALRSPRLDQIRLPFRFRR